MMASSRGRDRSSPRDGRGFGRIGCLLHQAEEHAIMNRAETEDVLCASARNRKLLAGLGLKPGENEYAEPALNPCQTTAYAFFTGAYLNHVYFEKRSFSSSGSRRSLVQRRSATTKGSWFRRASKSATRRVRSSAQAWQW